MPPPTELLSLLAVCAASTVGAVYSRDSETPAATLAQAVGLDMHALWTPTAAGYVEHASKAKALEAVMGLASDQVARLSKLKEGDLASEAERLIAGSGWLPAMLCGIEPDAEPAAGVAPVGAVDDAASERREDADVTASGHGPGARAGTFADPRLLVRTRERAGRRTRSEGGPSRGRGSRASFLRAARERAR